VKLLYDFELVFSLLLLLMVVVAFTTFCSVMKTINKGPFLFSNQHKGACCFGGKKRTSERADPKQICSFFYHYTFVSRFYTK